MVGRTTTRDASALPIFMSHRSRYRAPVPGLVVLALLLGVAFALRLL
jgi:hypothetical protein